MNPRTRRDAAWIGFLAALLAALWLAARPCAAQDVADLEIAPPTGPIESTPDESRLSPYNLGTYLLLAPKTDQDYERAIVALQDALALAPADTDALNNLAVAYLYLGEYAIAIERLQECLRANPEYVGVHVNLSFAYGYQGRHKQAEAEARKAANLLDRPELKCRALYNLGFFLDEQGRYDQAIAALQRAGELGLPLRSAIARAVAMANSGDTEGGVKLLEEAKQAAAADPDPSGILSPMEQELANAPFLLGLLEENLAAMRQVLAGRK